MTPLHYALVGAVAALIAVILILFLFGGGRLGLAIRCLWRALRDSSFAEKCLALLTPPELKDAGPTKPSGVPVRILALMQREGRLVDFLLEDVQAYSDAQIGASVREIHRQCQAVLKEHVILEPVIAKKEGDSIDVPAGFDPSAIRLVGNVTGQPPFKGTLQHAGWRVKEIKLSPPPEDQDDLVLMPAEVELA